MSEQHLYKNALTGHIFSGGPHMAEYARTQRHIFPCDAQGNPVHTEVPAPPPAAVVTESPRAEEPPRVDMERDPGTETGGEGQVLDRSARVSVIAEAIGALEPENPDDYTKEGLPRTSALEVATGLEEVTAEERDEALAMFKGQ